MPSPGLFSDSDLQAIRAAVAAAEAGTSGEIVPYVVGESDEYGGAAWKGAAFGALLGGLAGWAVHRWGGFWGTNLFAWMVLPPAAGAALGWLAGGELLDLRTRRRAAAAFLEEEVFRTRHRTGILLFVSLFERRVVVLGDAGVNAKVEPGEWDEVVRLAVEGIRQGRPGEGLAAAIAACGRLLARPGLERLPDDTDELPDELRRRET
jgi:putative membrane protein